VRSLYNAHYGEDGLKNPTAEEWAAFAAAQCARWARVKGRNYRLCQLWQVYLCLGGLLRGPV